AAPPLVPARRAAAVAEHPCGQSVPALFQPGSQRLGGKRHELGHGVIRQGFPADAAVVARIFRESRAEAMPWLPVLHTPEEDDAWFRERLAGEAWVYELDGSIVGFALIRDDDLDALYVA